MKKILLMAGALMLARATHAQVSVYNFAHEFGVVSDAESYPGAVITNHVVQDDVITPARVAPGFPFRFAGQLVDSFGIAENCYLYFSTLNPWATSSIWPISSAFPSQVTGIISALGVDLHPVTSDTQTTTVKTALIGTAPMRMLIIEWKHTSRIDALFDAAGPDDITFQIKLYESSNRVEVAYGNFTLNSNISEDAEIGLKGATYDDYINRVPTANDWSISSAGITQISRVRLNSTSAPAFGTLYVWESTGGGIPTAVDNVDRNNNVVLYPVPVTQELHVSADDALLLDATYTITNLTGKEVLKGKMQATIVDVNTLAAGSYIFSLFSDDKHVSKLFIKK